MTALAILEGMNGRSIHQSNDSVQVMCFHLNQLEEILNMYGKCSCAKSFYRRNVWKVYPLIRDLYLSHVIYLNQSEKTTRYVQRD